MSILRVPLDNSWLPYRTAHADTSRLPAQSRHSICPAGLAAIEEAEEEVELKRHEPCR